MPFILSLYGEGEYVIRFLLQMEFSYLVTTGWILWPKNLMGEFNQSIKSCFLLFLLSSKLNVNVQYDGGFLPDIILLTQSYLHRGTCLNAMKRFCICSL